MHHTARSRPRRPLVTVTAIAAASTLVLAGCGAGESESNSSGADGGDAASQSADQVADYTDLISELPDVPTLEGGVSSLAGKSVWYVTYGSAVPAIAAQATATQAALEAAGVDVNVCDGELTPTSIASCLDRAATQGADAVVAGQIDYDSVANSFDALTDAGIPVLIAQPPSSDVENTAELAYYDSTDMIGKAQELAADAIIADSDGTANVLFVGIADSSQTIDLSSRAVDYYADACGSCTVSSIEYNQASVNRLPTQVSSELLANPDIDYVQALYDVSVPSIISGAQSAGYADKIKISSTTAALDGLQRIANGETQFADVGFSLQYLGWLYADGILRMMTGSAPDWADNPGLIRVFNADNVGDVDLTQAAYQGSSWYTDQDLTTSFLTAWGVN